MFSQPVTSPPPGPTVVSPASPTHSSRTSRLRGLSYLRTYTQSHLLSRDSSSSSSSPPARASSSIQTRSPRTTAPPALPYSASGPPSSGLTSPAVEPPVSKQHTSPASSGSDTSLPSNLGRVSTRSSPASSLSQHLEAAPSIPGPLNPPASTPLPAATDIAALTASTPVAPLPPPAAAAAATESAMAQRTSSAGNGAAASAPPKPASPGDSLPSIRFSAYYDPRTPRPSLTFSPVSRTLPNGNDIIKVGRYSERDGSHPLASHNEPSAAPVGFKSKVVSRRHCEFWYEQGKWYIRDVKSSSGTFLNHIRLSPPGTESKPFPVNDGDIVQLGIDFKGGEEMIFRCVKMRLELNRGWQSKLNTFNMSTHKRLRNLATNGSGNASQDCSICLNAIAPCQCLFVAPCSHTWHYKCVRQLLSSPQFPIFVCPNCRATGDLEADVDESAEDWEQFNAGNSMAVDNGPNGDVPQAAAAAAAETVTDGPHATTDGQERPHDEEEVTESDAGDMTAFPNQIADPSSPQWGSPAVSNAQVMPIPIVGASPASGRHTPPGNGLANGNEGPITPRNDAGPWVFDGSLGNGNASRGAMRSLDATATNIDVDP